MRVLMWKHIKGESGNWPVRITCSGAVKGKLAFRARLESLSGTTYEFAALGAAGPDTG